MIKYLQYLKLDLSSCGKVAFNFPRPHIGLVPPSGDTSNRDSFQYEMDLMNTETKILEYYDGTNWCSISNYYSSAESQVLATGRITIKYMVVL